MRRTAPSWMPEPVTTKRRVGSWWKLVMPNPAGDALAAWWIRLAWYQMTDMLLPMLRSMRDLKPPLLVGGFKANENVSNQFTVSNGTSLYAVLGLQPFSTRLEGCDPPSGWARPPRGRAMR